MLHISTLNVDISTFWKGTVCNSFVPFSVIVELYKVEFIVKLL